MNNNPIRVLEEARRELGYDELAGNRTKFAAEAGHAQGFAWCATFVSAILIRCHVIVKGNPVLSPSSRTMYAEAKRKGWTVPFDKIQTGDVIHTWRGVSIGKWLGHVGFVKRVIRDKRGMITHLVTIEGNGSSAGSATGGQVVEITRSVSWWRIGAWRPPYGRP